MLNSVQRQKSIPVRLATKRDSGLGSPDWNVSMVNGRKRLSMCCSGHAGVKGNDQANIQTGGQYKHLKQLESRESEVLRSLRHYLWAHHTIDRLEERGVERGSARRSSLKGREKAIVSQTNIGTVSKAMLGKLLRDGVERGCFSERTDSISK